MRTDPIAGQEVTGERQTMRCNPLSTNWVVSPAPNDKAN